jgi:hypothetical protein
MNWIELAVDRVCWWAVVEMVMNLLDSWTA